MTKTINLTINGKKRTDSVEPRLLLIHYLREVIGLTGPLPDPVIGLPPALRRVIDQRDQEAPIVVAWRVPATVPARSLSLNPPASFVQLSWGETIGASLCLDHHLMLNPAPPARSRPARLAAAAASRTTSFRFCISGHPLSVSVVCPASANDEARSAPLGVFRHRKAPAVSSPNSAKG